MNTRPLVSMLWLIHMLFHRLMKVIGIGIATPILWLMFLKRSLQNFGVIVDFTVLGNSLEYLKWLSAKLQNKIDSDVFETYTMIDNIKWKIQWLRDNIGVKFQWWYDEAKQLASYIGTEEEMPRVPRVPRVRCNRSNVPADTLLLYYKKSTCIPFIDIIKLQQF